VHRRRGIRAVALTPPLPPAAHLRYSVGEDGEERGAGGAGGQERRVGARDDERRPVAVGHEHGSIEHCQLAVWACLGFGNLSSRLGLKEDRA
jgi:hypothetical protein